MAIYAVFTFIGNSRTSNQDSSSEGSPLSGTSIFTPTNPEAGSEAESPDEAGSEGEPSLFLPG